MIVDEFRWIMTAHEKRDRKELGIVGRAPITKEDLDYLEAIANAAPLPIAVNPPKITESSFYHTDSICCF